MRDFKLIVTNFLIQVGSVVMALSISLALSAYFTATPLHRAWPVLTEDGDPFLRTIIFCLLLITGGLATWNTSSST